MREKVLWAIAVIVLVSMNGYILSEYVQSVKHRDLHDQVSEHQEEKLASFKTSLYVNVLNSNYLLDSIVVRDALDNHKYLSDIFDQGQDQILVFRYSQPHCESCIQASIKVIKEYSDQLGVSNLIFIGNYQNNRIYRKTLFHYEVEDIKAYNSAMLHLPAEELEFPYLFVLDKNGRTSNVFLPNKGFPDITMFYLENIIKKFNRGCISSHK